MVRRYACETINGRGSKIFFRGGKGMLAARRPINRLFVDAVLYRYRAGVPWRDLPERFGDWKNTHRRWSRWAESGILEKIFKQLAGDTDHEYAMIDSTMCVPINIARALKKWRRPSHGAEAKD